MGKPVDLNEARDDGVLGCSGISWTICSLHLAPGRQPHQHLITHYFTGQVLLLMPDNSVKALKALVVT